jgi:hypothetical protein
MPMSKRAWRQEDLYLTAVVCSSAELNDAQGEPRGYQKRCGHTLAYDLTYTAPAMSCTAVTSDSSRTLYK